MGTVRLCDRKLEESNMHALWIRWAFAAGVLCGGGTVRAEPIKAKVTRDLWISSHPGETAGNNGGSARLKLKSYQEFVLMDFDPAPFAGRAIASGKLHVRLADNERLWRVTVGSVAAPWVEGTGTDYAVQEGSSSYEYRLTGTERWPGWSGHINTVTLGLGGTLWGMADATDPDGEKWQTIAIDPRVLRARVAGVSEGLVVFDDTGSEWTRDGEKFTPRPFPNRRFFSREQSASAPYLTIEPGPEDKAAPGKIEFVDVPAELATWARAKRVVAWRTPADEGPAGTIGFFAKLGDKPVPQWLLPAAGAAGEIVVCDLSRWHELPDPGEHRFVVSAVDGAGNRGPESTTVVKIAYEKPFELPGKDHAFPPEAKGTEPLPKIGQARIAVVDTLDKQQPVTGEMIPRRDPGYLRSNMLWSAKTKTVTLSGARGEFVSFQVLVDGPLPSAEFRVKFPKLPKLKAEIGALRTVPTPKGPLPDPLIPLEKPTTLPLTEDAAVGAKSAGVIVELYIPKDAPPGAKEGTLEIVSGKSQLDLQLDLNVWNFEIPDRLSFIPELNCYGLPEDEEGYYRLAHKHRCVLNRVPYSQRGTMADGMAPVIKGDEFDWSAWDKRFGKYFDGSAFADLPRAGVPLELFYLPMHENWPAKMEGNYNGSYWADEAFPPAYRQAFVEATRKCAEHVAEKKWTGTLFHGFLNNKVDFKKNGWSRASSPWLLDEPAHWQDFHALKFFGEAFAEGRAAAASKFPPGLPIPLLYRCDISRPEWQRDALDAVLDYNVVAGQPFDKFRDIVLDRKDRHGQIVMVYGTANDITANNVQGAAWGVAVWCQGGDGILPWQTIGTADSWKQADQLSLLYPGAGAGSKTPIPSVRLKAYLRAQQDAELLRMVAEAAGVGRGRLRLPVQYGLSAQKISTGAAGEDAGVMDFQNVTADRLGRLRKRLGDWLSAAPRRDDLPAPPTLWTGPRERKPTPNGVTAIR
jgi:hypothetical protein